MLDDSLFDDPDRLAEADTGGLLRMAALAGAQVRSTSETVSEAGLDELTEHRPRALVLLARPGISPAVCRLLSTLTGASCSVPVLVADSVPSWIGPLDVVFAYTDDVGDTVLAESLALAARRGAAIVLAAPPDGPVAAAAAGRAKLLPPKIQVPTAFSFTHAFTAGLSVLQALDLVRVDTELFANELDHESARAAPSHETLMNPAKSLALRLAEHTPLLWGVDSVSTAVAEHGAFALGYHVGVACDVSDYTQAASRHALYRVAVSLGSETDLFADPEDQVGGRLRSFLISVRHDARAEAEERAAVQALPGADLVTPSESVADDAVLRSALLALRFDLASVYLGLAAGTLNGPGYQMLAMH